MWPFSKGRAARERDFIRAAFARYMSPALIEKLSKAPFDRSLERRRIFFALLQPRDDDPAVLAERLKCTVDIAVEAQGMIDFMPPFLLVSFGFPLTDRPENLRSQRQQMVEKLLSVCGRDIRIVYGEADGLVGNTGSERRFNYGAVIPRFSTAMQQLLALDFGLASEVQL